MKRILITMFAVVMLVSASSAIAQTDILVVEGTRVGFVIPTTNAEGVVGQAFVLDGSISQDDGVIRSFSWKQVSGPTVRLANTTTWEPSFVPTQAGTYVFDLSVTDSTGKTSVARHFEVVVTGSIVVPVAPPSGSTEAGPALLEIDTIKGESPEKKKGNIEYEWKVEEGESAAPTNPNENKVTSSGEPVTPDFGILLGGGDSEQAQTIRAQIAEILLKGAKEEGAPVEQVSLTFEKIKIKSKQQIKLFGFITMPVLATVEIDTKGEARASFPWWAFLASGKNKEQLRQETLSTLSSVLKKNQALVDGLLIIRY